MMPIGLHQLADQKRTGAARGLVSVCSAHPLVLRAALHHGVKSDATVLIEATCNQVNHRGGYTGMQPADFAALVRTLADEEGCPMEQVILGGDHLGPNPWRDQPADIAMKEAETMVRAYVSAGFRKIHLDASMGCAGEPAALDDIATAERAVRLAAVAEETAQRQGGARASYIIGTEVPPPGGADHVLDEISPTSYEAVRQTIDVHRDHFSRAGLSDAFERVIGIVVQPGVEFGNHNIIHYARDKAVPLISILDDEPGLVFEAHSTDYQGIRFLTELVEDGFAILKVGPELTFVLREALYALDLIASDLVPDHGDRPLMKAMERLMQDDPSYWNQHYTGDPAMQALLRHYSLSDRIRYYWTNVAAETAVKSLIDTLQGCTVPLPLMWQHLPCAAKFADRPLDVEGLLTWRIGESLSAYHAACRS